MQGKHKCIEQGSNFLSGRMFLQGNGIKLNSEISFGQLKC